MVGSVVSGGVGAVSHSDAWVVQPQAGWQLHWPHRDDWQPNRQENATRAIDARTDLKVTEGPFPDVVVFSPEFAMKPYICRVPYRSKNRVNRENDPSRITVIGFSARLGGPFVTIMPIAGIAAAVGKQQFVLWHRSCTSSAGVNAGGF
jgi:hypothetical protein